jgi:hypothetical protein
MRKGVGVELEPNVREIGNMRLWFGVELEPTCPEFIQKF